MVRHIVMFKLKEYEHQTEKMAKLVEFKHLLEGLMGKIEVLKSMEVGINMNPAETFDFVLVSEFDSLEDVDIYAKHPAHVAVAKQIAEVRESRACVDYFI